MSTFYVYSGIRELDIVQENLRHYVENELFKGKKQPAKTDRRFYLKDRTVRSKLELVPSIYRDTSKKDSTAMPNQRPSWRVQHIK